MSLSGRSIRCSLKFEKRPQPPESVRLVRTGAARVIKPSIIVDAATLTGAQLIATGLRHSGIVSNRDGVEARAVETGKASGDLAHPLPFAPEFYQAEFASKVADMRNSVANRANAQAARCTYRRP